MRRFVLLCGCILLGTAAVAPDRAAGKSPYELLVEQPTPKFRPDHTLPPLTRWGWNMPYDVRVELCERWGYALEFGVVNQRTLQKLDDPESVESKLVALVDSNPKKYPLLVTTLRPFHDRAFLNALPEAAWCHDAQGNRLGEQRPTLSPEAPAEIYQKAARITADPIAELRKRAPIAVIHNGGEYGMSVFGFHGESWRQDPRVVAAKGTKSWFAYLSDRKAFGERIIADEVRRAARGGLYLYYPTSGCPHRNRNSDWWKWCYGYEQMQPVSDVPNGESYYKHFNTGWTGEIDMLTLALNSVGLQIACGRPLSYNWLCLGWERKDMGEEAFGEFDRYMGFLKCYYTAGMTGGVAGYFSYPQGGFGADLGDEMPHWLEQMIVLGRAHALFSHLEEFLREGDLLPGPQMHRWSRERPAYEMPTGDAGVRVVARKHRRRNEWLVTAWAAGGEDRQATVEILGLGELKLDARTCGSVYRVKLRDGQPEWELVDRNGMLPTQPM
ncbi:MAG TPA: hypothetical protein VMY42_27995 [Thermoguttaceae bacterium]|nr:hypothetical protein [Thermoguttaceae bacterium]